MGIASGWASGVGLSQFAQNKLFLQLRRYGLIAFPPFADVIPEQERKAL
jgi:hypothetical protein